MAIPVPPEPGAPIPSESSVPVAPGPVVPISAAPAVAYASLGDRALAVILDLLVAGAVGWAAGMLLAPRFGGLTAEGFSLQGRPALIIMGISALAFLVYHVCFEWWFGATLGKIVAGARITGVDGGPIDFRRSLIRNLLRVIDFVVFYLLAAILVLLTSKRQRIGDMVARTVVTRRDYPGLGRALALLILVALPVAAVAGTWSLRAPAAGDSTGPTLTTTTSDSSTRTGGTTGGGAISAGGGARLAPVADGPFTLGNLRAAEGPDGPDRSNANYKPGESATLRYDVSGFDTSPGKGRVRISFTARDPFDVVVIKPVESIQEPPAGESSLSAWARVSLPEYAWPGTYHVDLTIADLVANRQVKASMPFTVEGMPIEPSDTLTLRNVRVTEGDGGPTRASAIYRAGDTLWVAFDIVGFKAGAEGAIGLKAEMEVTTGSQHSARQQLFELNERFPYVPRRLPATSHLTLGGMSPGDYVMTLYFTDSTGNQRYEQPVRFTIQQ